MFKWLILITALFFCPVICLAAGKPSAVDNLTAGDKTEDSCLWDFGKVKEGELLSHAFTLENKSPKVLNIKDVSASCGCTKPEIKKKKLSKGQSTTIEVKFNTKGYSGKVQQFIYVHTDSQDTPIIRFTVKAEIEKK